MFAIDPCFVLWGIAVAFALWRQSAVGIAFAGAWLLHSAFDFPLHNHDARMHFWRLTDWKFISPISYWDNSRGGAVVGVAELILAATLSVVLVRRHLNTWARVGFVALWLT